MKKKIKLRAYVGDDGITTVKAILFHPMETGMRKDRKTGKTIPAHHITEAVVEHNGKPVLTCLWGTGVSKNPFLSFDLKNTQVGDRIRISWVDNKGASDAVEARLS